MRPTDAIRFEAVRREYPGPDGATVAALDGVDLTVAAGELVAVVGRSGCGKSTLLRCVNRLVRPSAGRVAVHGQDVAEVDVIALRRGIGYVVQSGALFPHRTVAENVGLLCELEGWDPAATEARVRALLALVRLAPDAYAARYPRELSGGERQRVGVARALALDPPVLLMDEPFGALDPITRRELQDEFADALRAPVGADARPRTIVLVTHDLDEAFTLGDRVALLEAGRVLQVGAPRELLDAPADDHVAAFVAHHLPREGGRR